MANKLFTTAYQEPVADRRREFEECLRLNSRDFDEVVVLAQGMQYPSGFTGRWFNCEERQKYADLLGLARSADHSDVVIIANADIVIRSTALRQIDESIREDQAYCLTRWDIGTKGIKLFDTVHSQDSWAFRGPPKENVGGDYCFGCPGVDNRFAHELDAAGYEVLNPSRDIQTYHLHASGIRTSNTAANRVPLPYLFIKPHYLGEKPQYGRPAKASKRPSQFRV